MIKSLWIIILLTCNYSIFCQDIKYANEVLDKLTSQQFHGRGYVERGDRLASEYIAGQLQRWDVKQINNSYFQPFNISVNTFPNDVFVEIDSSKLILGEDYNIVCYSGSCNGLYRIIWLTNENINTLKSQNLSKLFLVIDTAIITNKTHEILEEISQIKRTNAFHAKGIIEIIDKDRITQSISQYVKDFPVIQIKKNKFNKDSKQINIKVKNKFIKKYKTQNVAGFIQGQSDSIVIFCAHYDHLGQIGSQIYFPGANDNASGVSMLLNIAEYYNANKVKPKYSIIFLFFSAEELGLIGSSYYVFHPLAELSKTKFLINFDMVGLGDKGIMVVNATKFKEQFKILDSINTQKHYIDTIKQRGESTNSDHYFFYKKGVKSFYIYTMGKSSEYHNIYDNKENINLFAFENILKLVVDFINKI